jgi:hypothetical protein
VKRTKLGPVAVSCTVIAGLGSLATGATPVHATNGGQLSLSLCSPSQTFKQDRNGPVIDNRYSPFVPGSSMFYSDGMGNSTTVSVAATSERPAVFTFSGGVKVETRRVQELDQNADGTHEVSQNWYAQTTAGTVCYFGEVETDFDAGGHVIPPNPAQGSWCSAPSGPCTAATTGPNFAPGIVMPANPQVGQKFQEEFAPGVAEDEGEIVGIDSTDTINGVTYSNVIRMLEGDDLSSGQGHTDTKLFAPNVGAIRDETLLLVP